MPESKKAQLRERFAGEEYPIHLIGRHLDITEPMKAYAIEKLKKTERFGVRVIEATIVMDIQKLVHSVDFILNVNNIVIKVSGKSENMYTSTDLAIGHLQTKLRRYHKRISEHHKRSPKEIEMNVNVIRGISPLDEINDLIEEENLQKQAESLKPHEIVKKKTMPLKMLNQGEAIMKMDLSGENFLVYRGEEDQRLKVIYRRDDGNYGIIEVE